MVNHQTLNQNNKSKAAFNSNIWVCCTKPDRQQKPHPQAPVSGNHLWSSLEPRNSQCFGVMSSSLTLNTQEWMKKMCDLTEHLWVYMKMQGDAMNLRGTAQKYCTMVLHLVEPCCLHHPSSVPVKCATFTRPDVHINKAMGIPAASLQGQMSFSQNAKSSNIP